MPKLTVVCREAGYPDVLIYSVDVENLDQDTVQAAIQKERNADLGDIAGDMDVLFAFAGDLYPAADWRD